MKLDGKKIGMRIKNRRKSLGITQIDVKTATGISSGNMSEIENGNRLPSAPALIQLANLLQCSVDWLLTGESPHQENFEFFEIGDPDEIALIKGFRELPKDEQNELLEILEMKLRKVKKTRKDTTFTCSQSEADIKEFA